MSTSYKTQLLASELADCNTDKLSDNDINDLRSMLSNMSLHSPRNSTPIREPKVNDPHKFSGVNDHLGENRLENFITQVNMVIRLQSSRFPDELSKVFFAASYMTDIAFKWIQPYIAAVGIKKMKTLSFQTMIYFAIHCVKCLAMLLTSLMLKTK